MSPPPESSPQQSIRLRTLEQTEQSSLTGQKGEVVWRNGREFGSESRDPGFESCQVTNVVPVNMAPASRVHVIFVLVSFVLFQAAEARCPDGCDCEPGIFPVDVTCTGEKILSIPQNIPIFTTSLTITNTGITEVRADDLKALKRLRTLLLPNNKISTIDAGAFDELSRLEFFDISGLFKNCRLLKELNGASNHISSLPEDLLSAGLSDAAETLTTLDLYDNEMDEIPAGAFQGLRNLNRLNLANSLKDFARWLNMSSPMLEIEVECRSPSKYFGKKLRDLDVDELTCDDCKPQTSAPKIDQSGVQVQGTVGKDTVLTCNVTACPQAEIFWTIPQSPGVELSNYNMAATWGVLVTFALVTFVLFQTTGAACPKGCLCQPTTTHPFLVTCTGGNIMNIPSNLPPNITSLTLTSTGITEVRATDLKGLTRLTRLLLPSNKISTIESGALDDLAHLEFFDISGNTLTTLPSGLFKNCPILMQLNMGSNQISTLSESDLSGLTHLEFLDLSDNQITSIGARVFQDLDNLNRLGLSGNNLTDLDSTLFEYTPKLFSLDLSDNQITKISKSLFSNAKHLNQIVLSNNMISMIEDGAFEASNLNTLNIQLNNNQLTSITKNTFKTGGKEGISSLTLNDNKIATIEAGSFDHAKFLRTLDLSHNELTTVPAGLMSESVSLSLVSFEFNKLQSFPKGVFGTTTRVETLNLANNQLTEVGDGALDVYYLQEVDLSYNMLSEISFSGLKNVQTISLNNNKLKAPPTGLSDAAFLMTLDLYDNDMDEIPAHAFEGLERLSRLNLANTLNVNGTLNAQAFATSLPCNLWF
ncbi:hypothetical protein Bbelb_153030 [Branchiostoma belcheri]|nr:hypothetical protein Bbelb_153030 [Branchiostoma belcheri]